MTKEEYLASPTRASSLSYRKSRSLVLPEGIRVVPDRLFRADEYPGWEDEIYFRLIHRMENLDSPVIPPGFELRLLPPEAFRRHIALCYGMKDAEAALSEISRPPLYDPAFWVALCPAGSGEPAASGIAVLDPGIREGSLEWIQVSPAFRRRGLGKAVVLILLGRFSGRASFVTVSGRENSVFRPSLLYESAGFREKALWHVLREKKQKASRK